MSLAVAVLLGAASVPSATAVATSPRPGHPQAGPVTSAGTPLFSLRRIPAVLAQAAADARLASDLDRALAEPELGGARESSCLSVQDPTGRTVYSRRPDSSLIPASTMKLATATVALAKLGPSTRLVTEARAGARSPDGAVGDLWLVGGGDPLLSTAGFAVDGGFGGQPRLATSMESLADLVVASGVRRVSGRVIGDDSRYDQNRVVPTWDPRYLSTFEVSPLSALIVDKGFVARAPAKPVLAVSPAAHAASVLAEMLTQRGVPVDGGTAEGPASPEAAVVARIESPPMNELVGQVLQNSDNLGAELIIKELGFRLGGAGSTAAGLEVMRGELAAMAIDLDGFTTADGSGLDRSDRLTCTVLQDLLDRNGEGRELDLGLPVAGRNGTLYRRFVGTPAAGRVRAKTGGLTGVVTLAGWVSPVAGGTMQFSLLLNELPRSAAGAALQDKVVSSLATYPVGPGADQLRPVAPTPVFAPAPAAG